LWLYLHSAIASPPSGGDINSPTGGYGWGVYILGLNMSASIRLINRRDVDCSLASCFSDPFG
jgi:hypothetical protein